MKRLPFDWQNDPQRAIIKYTLWAVSNAIKKSSLLSVAKVENLLAVCSVSFDKFGHLEKMCGDYLDGPPLSGCSCEATLPEYLPLALRSEMASKVDFYNCDNRQLLAHNIYAAEIILVKILLHCRVSGKLQCRGRLWHECASAGAFQMGTQTSEQDIPRYVMWHNVSPCLNPPAARTHATDPKPCLNRCSINNACFGATHLPGAQSGNRRMDKGDGANEWVCPGEARGGRRMGEGQEARVTTEGWIRQKKLKDQWTWGWSVLLVPSAPAQKEMSVLLQPTREICRNKDKKKEWSQESRARVCGYTQHACVVVEEHVSTLRGILWKGFELGCPAALNISTYPGTIGAAIW